MSNVGEILAFCGYAIASFMFYTFVPFLLKVEWLYFVAFALVVTGLIIYSKTEKDPASAPAIEEANGDQRYQLLNEDEEQADDHRHDATAS
ncbi:hypothetical protein K7X08_015609 [Anisodus acutangulus]|uniref:Uncharacterized protein n=1 Tax=Anisodus acutangulus TaxID=402998 RepID=A0A9Q1LEH0_9SOLA|nr:hypothetical protein K7X08_015609 [Anisodus acutangulus]